MLTNGKSAPGSADLTTRIKSNSSQTLLPLSVFSFQSTKNLTSGEGGFLACNSRDVFKRAHTIHQVGRPPQGMPWGVPRLGYNYRASEYVAVLLDERLKDLDAQMAKRDASAK